jgi:hypothetical protein
MLFPAPGPPPDFSGMLFVLFSFLLTAIFLRHPHVVKPFLVFWCPSPSIVYSFLLSFSHLGIKSPRGVYFCWASQMQSSVPLREQSSPASISSHVSPQPLSPPLEIHNPHETCLSLLLVEVSGIMQSTLNILLVLLWAALGQSTT